MLSPTDLTIEKEQAAVNFIQIALAASPQYWPVVAMTSPDTLMPIVLEICDQHPDLAFTAEYSAMAHHWADELKEALNGKAAESTSEGRQGQPAQQTQQHEPGLSNGAKQTPEQGA